MAILEMMACRGTDINPSQPIVPKVDLPLLDDKCMYDIWNHFETAIFLSLCLFHAF